MSGKCFPSFSSLFFALFRRAIVYVAFDRDFAMTQQLPVRCIEYAMMCFIAVTIVLSIRLVGIMLLISLLTLPQATANLFAMAQAEQQAAQQTAPSAPGPQGDAPAAAGGTPKFCPECGQKLE